MSKINESIQHLAIQIDRLTGLPNNPRKGDIDAIMASYSEFGQVKPIVARQAEDGALVVIAGNHQLEAARRLGWNEIAVVQLAVDEKTALAYAMADNRTVELGYTDEQLLADILAEISDDYSDLLESLQYDAFELAAIQSAAESVESILDDGYVPPVIYRDQPSQDLRDQVSVSTTDKGETKIEALPHVDTKTAVTTGSTSVNASGSQKAVIQYTLVFDDAEQQRHWYNFIRFVRNSPAYDGETTAERLMSFIDAHADF